MALDDVARIDVICHRTRKEEVLARIESSASVHLIDMSETEVTEGEFFAEPVEVETDWLSERMAYLDRVLDFLTPYAPPGTIMERMSAVPPEFTEEELLRLLDDKRLIRKAELSWRVAMEQAKIEGNEKEHLQEAQFLREWENLSCDLSKLQRRGAFGLVAGTAARDAIGKVHAIADETPLLDVTVVGSPPGMERILAVYHASIADEVLQRLSEAGFVTQDFGGRSGTAASLLDRTLTELEKLRETERRLEARAVKLAEELPGFRSLRDAAGLLLTRLRAQESGRKSSAVVSFQAWTRRKDLEPLRKRLDELSEVTVEEREPGPGEVPPSPLTETPVAEPYTLLTDMFGKPDRRDPDPTPLMAPFYALFFGICIGDAGYGLALAAGSALGWFLSARRGGNPRLFRLLFQGGLVSVVVGIFLGGWFGISFDSLPPLLKAPAELLNAIVPGYTPGQTGQETFGVSKQFLYVTLGLGLVQLAWGVVVNLMKRLKAGEGLPAVIDQTGWVLALAGLFPWLFNHYLLDGALYDMQSPVDSVFLYMLLTGAVLIFVMGGREASGFGKVGLGAYAAYGIVNLLGDVLSYSRLFALGLSSAIIALVINQIAGMLMTELGIPVVGVVLAVAVLVGGHLFNLFMASLSGFIHTARLQFVEFFSKFYDGTGVPFEPLKYTPRYVNIRRTVIN
jgi:V/A-type H+-transporting ATPase subunit I